MSNRKIIILAVIAALMITLTIIQSRVSNKPKPQQESLRYLIQGLDPADIGSIVMGTGEDAVTLKRLDQQFVVVNKDNYPAVINEINKLITSCLDIQTTELYTNDPANHKDLGVTEEDARSIIKFLRPDSSLITGIVIGNMKEQGQGNYVRSLSSNEVYVTSEAPWIKSRPIDYINRDLISVGRTDIELVTVTYPDETYTLRARNHSVLMDNIPEGKKQKDNDCQRVLTALTNLRFEDVMSTMTPTDKELNFEKKYVCRLKDSTVYTLKIAKKFAKEAYKTYVMCDADFTDKTPITKDQEVEPEEQLKKKEAKLLARDKAKEFSEKHQGWVYEIVEYQAENLTKILPELLEDLEEPEETVPTVDSNDIEAQE